MLTETVALLEEMSRRAADLAGALPALDLAAEDLAALAGEAQRINARLADAEERIAAVGPAASLELPNFGRPAIQRGRRESLCATAL
jgi:hypothetical protein